MLRNGPRLRLSHGRSFLLFVVTTWEKTAPITSASDAFSHILIQACMLMSTPMTQVSISSPCPSKTFRTIPKTPSA